MVSSTSDYGLLGFKYRKQLKNFMRGLGADPKAIDPEKRLSASVITAKQKCW